jgi:hypothetical protein
MRMTFNVLSVSILLGCSLVASAGPQFDKAREVFTSSRLPTVADLKLGETWNCVSYGLEKYVWDQVSISNGLYIFSEQKGYIGNTGQHSVRWFNYSPNGFFGSMNGLTGEKLNFIRVTSFGDLITEFASDPWDSPTGGTQIGRLYPPTAAFESKTKRAISYSHCTTKPVGL